MLNHVPQEAAETTQKPLGRPTRPFKSPRRHYSDRDRADALTALQAHGGNVAETAKALDIPAATLYLWAGVGGQRTALLEPEVRLQRLAPVEVHAESKRDYSEALTKARWLYLDRMVEPDAVAKTSGYYAAVTTKILTEQHQLLTGGATSRTELSLASFLGSTAIEASVVGDKP